jgi:hypothetical protein
LKSSLTRRLPGLCLVKTPSAAEIGAFLPHPEPYRRQEDKSKRRFRKHFASVAAKSASPATAKDPLVTG